MRTVIFKCDECGKEQETDHRQAPYEWYTLGYFHNGGFYPMHNYCADCGPTIKEIAENEERRRRDTGFLKPFRNMFRRGNER